MARRRLSPNPRYPLMTPENDREAFIDYNSHDGDATRSQDHFAHPVYQPHEESSGPRLVPVAQQPEMVRRQSLRPSSGHWGTFDIPSPSGDSKLPGSFHDTGAEDLGPEMIETTPRGVTFGHSHPAEPADLYSDGSDEDLDVRHDRHFAFPQLPIEDVVFEVAYVLRMKSNPTGQGFTYVFADPSRRSKFYKIGSAKNVSRRANEHHSICSLSSFKVQRKPAIPIREYKRLEKLAQTELMNLNYDPNCVCTVDQREYFWGKEQTAVNVLESWSKWLVKHSPYNKDGRLQPFWEHRLRVFEANVPRYFNCQLSKCTRRSTDTIACQSCLRAGWKAWSEPSSVEKIEFASHTQIGIEWVHRILVFLHKYIPMPEHIFLTSIDGMGWTVSMWDRFKSPALLLNVLYARLLIPMILSSIFTATDYIPVTTLIEMALFSVIYQLVRTELVQAVAQGDPSKRSKASRSPNRKALLMAADGRSSKDPSFIEISDGRVQNIFKQPTSQGKGTGNGKKPDSISTLFPREAAAQLRRIKTGRRRSDFV